MRRGWIGNESTPGFEIGSKIWLYEQARLTRSILNGITTSVTQSLQWMIDDGYALSIKIETILTATGVGINIIIQRPNSKVENRYYDLWNNTGISHPENQTFFQLTVPTEDLGPTDGSRVVGYNIFDKVGNPKYAVDVIVYLFNQCGGVGSPTVSTGSGWHVDSKITIYNDTNNQVLGGGGKGGIGGETSGNGGVGTGGSGGNTFGFAGSPGAYPGEYVFDPTSPDAGSPTGGTVDRVATDGGQGFPCIEMFHPITFMNHGTISGGCGGGGGGGADGGTGGDGASHGFQANPVAGDDGTGTEPGLGGGINFAIVTNNHSIIYNPEGLIRGGVS
jgi:hypothetical protein